MDAKGYGADLKFDGQNVVIKPGAAGRSVGKTDTITVPVTDLTGIKWRGASLLVNGQIRFLVDKPKELLVEYGGPGSRVTAEALAVAFTKKHAAEFEAIRDALTKAGVLVA